MSSHYDRMSNKSSNFTHFNILNRERVNYLLSLIRKAHTTSILHQLEYHREKLHRPAFRMLLLLLTKELNSDIWNESFYDLDDRAFRRNLLNWKKNWRMPIKNDIDQCCLIIFYYIVSVINKYKISSSEEIWNEILENRLTKNKQFYQYLHKKKIILPNKICKLYSEKFGSFYASQSIPIKIKLIELGFMFDGIINHQTKIKDLEKIFFLLKQGEKLNNCNIQPEKIIVFMNIPEKLSLFLSCFPNYDINQVNKQTKLSVLEQLINMKPYIYLPDIPPTIPPYPVRYVSNVFTIETLAPFPTSPLYPHPNEIVKYRAARIINLLQQLIGRGARLSKPVFSDIMGRSIAGHQFFATSIGIYVLIDLYMNDLYPCELPLQRDERFVLFILKYIRIFSLEFQAFISYRLSLSYLIIHKPEFMIERRKNENEHLQKINDILFQRSLTLKQWCRLKIKDNCLQKDIIKLNLSQSLINYCTFDFFDPNYAIQSIKEVVKHGGNVLPKWILYESETSIQYDNADEDDDSNEQYDQEEIPVNNDDDYDSNDW